MNSQAIAPRRPWLQSSSFRVSDCKFLWIVLPCCSDSFLHFADVSGGGLCVEVDAVDALASASFCRKLQHSRFSRWHSVVLGVPVHEFLETCVQVGCWFVAQLGLS